MTESSKLRAAVFLDRDGTINIEKRYLYQYEDWEWIAGAIKAIKKFNDAGVLVIVITNQAGVARGIYTSADVESLHERVSEELQTHGAHIDAYYYCPHHPEFGNKMVCSCRKPAPGLLFQAQKEWDIDLHRSAIFGDKASDIKVGQAAGVKSFLVSTGYGQLQRNLVTSEMHYVDNILTAAEFYLDELLS
jgi:D-glycero-D-manno-heptose 1,7-bisphosphate phosphatase